jgi:hypothetical protein
MADAVRRVGARAGGDLRVRDRARGRRRARMARFESDGPRPGAQDADRRRERADRRDGPAATPRPAHGGAARVVGPRGRSRGVGHVGTVRRLRPPPGRALRVRAWAGRGAAEGRDVGARRRGAHEPTAGRRSCRCSGAPSRRTAGASPAGSRIPRDRAARTPRPYPACRSSHTRATRALDRPERPSTGCGAELENDPERETTLLAGLPGRAMAHRGALDRHRLATRSYEKDPHASTRWRSPDERPAVRERRRGTRDGGGGRAVPGASRRPASVCLHAGRRLHPGSRDASGRTPSATLGR